MEWGERDGQKGRICKNLGDERGFMGEMGENMAGGIKTPQNKPQQIRNTISNYLKILGLRGERGGLGNSDGVEGKRIARRVVFAKI